MGLLTCWIINIYIFYYISKRVFNEIFTGARAETQCACSELHPGTSELPLPAEAQLSPGKVKSSRGLWQNIVLVFQLKFIKTKFRKAPPGTLRWSSVFESVSVREEGSFQPGWSTFVDGRKVGDESEPAKEARTCLVARVVLLSIVVVALKIFNLLKLRLGRVESGRKVVFWAEHGTTRPARGAESRNPVSSGKWKMVLF